MFLPIVVFHIVRQARKHRTVFPIVTVQIGTHIGKERRISAILENRSGLVSGSGIEMSQIILVIAVLNDGEVDFRSLLQNPCDDFLVHFMQVIEIHAVANVALNGRPYARRGRRWFGCRFRFRRRRLLGSPAHGIAGFDGELLRIGAAFRRTLRSGGRLGRLVGFLLLIENCQQQRVFLLYVLTLQLERLRFFRLDFLGRDFRNGRAVFRRQLCRRRGLRRLGRGCAQCLLLNQRQFLLCFPIFAGHLEEKEAHRSCYRQTQRNRGNQKPLYAAERFFLFHARTILD